MAQRLDKAPQLTSLRSLPPRPLKSNAVPLKKRLAGVVLRALDPWSNGNTVALTACRLRVRVAQPAPLGFSTRAQRRPSTPTIVDLSTPHQHEHEQPQKEETPPPEDTEETVPPPPPPPPPPPQAPEADGTSGSAHVRVAFISDLHYNGVTGSASTHGGTFVCVPAARLRHMVECINLTRPDIVVIGGDLVDADGLAFADELADTYLAQLRATHGVYAVLGNHDRCRPGSRKAVVAALERAGVVLLDNTTVRPLPFVELVGVDDVHHVRCFKPDDAFAAAQALGGGPALSTRPAAAPRTAALTTATTTTAAAAAAAQKHGKDEEDEGDDDDGDDDEEEEEEEERDYKEEDEYEKAEVCSHRIYAQEGRYEAPLAVGGGAPLACCRIVVTHTPDTAPILMRYAAHLQLSGHTHGGQVCLPRGDGRPVPAWLYEDVGGASVQKHAWAYYRSLRNWEWASGLHLLREQGADPADPGMARYLFVTRGIGSHCPGRFACRPEVAVIDIEICPQ